MRFRNENAFMSNMYNAPITIGAYTFKCVESAFQAMKDTTKMAEFSKMDGRQAKAAGRHVKLDVKDWNAKRVSVMKTIVTEKFKQNPELMTKLLNVKGHIQEDNTWNDTFWGVCNGRGRNELGKILMEIRDNNVKVVKENKTMKTKTNANKLITVEDRIDEFEAYGSIASERQSGKASNSYTLRNTEIVSPDGTVEEFNPFNNGLLRKSDDFAKNVIVDGITGKPGKYIKVYYHSVDNWVNDYQFIALTTKYTAKTLQLLRQSLGILHKVTLKGLANEIRAGHNTAVLEVSPNLLNEKYPYHTWAPRNSKLGRQILVVANIPDGLSCTREYYPEVQKLLDMKQQLR